MPGLLTLFLKELSDHFRSKRILVLLALVWLSGLSAIYIAGQSIRENVPESGFVFLQLFIASSGTLPPFISFIAFFGPLVGLSLGFDAINREQTGGTLSLLLSQPVYRDTVIGGKFLAGMSVISFMLVSIVLIVSGLGLWMLAVPPSLEEVLRIIAYLAVTVVYIGFWMSLAMLFSIFFKRITTSALAGLAIWLFLIVFMPIVAGLAADKLAPVDTNSVESIIRNQRVNQAVERISPASLYEEATAIILRPTAKSLGPLSVTQAERLMPNPLPFSQSLLIIWPHIIAIIGFTSVCFGISYVRFMRREIRA